MLEACEWFLRCDEDGCTTPERHDDNPFRLEREAREEGWQLRVKRNGEPAIRGGKYYCPQHTKTNA